MQENQDFVVHQAVQHLDKELRHYHLLVDIEEIDKVRNNQERRVVVVGKDEQAANDQAVGDTHIICGLLRQRWIDCHRRWCLCWYLCWCL